MITALPRTSALRTRVLAGPQRVLAVALILFAFLYTHGVSLDGVRGHTDTAAATALAPATAESAPIDHHGEGHGASHSAEECATSQPQQPPIVDAPAEHLLAWCVPGLNSVPAGQSSGPAPALGVPRPPGATAILRI